MVGTEVEALQLEYSWIKEFDPRFNVKYRDDKSYPYLAVTMGEEYPRVQVMRGAKRKGTRYFGPYSHAWAIRDTVDTLLRVFPVRTCSAGVFKRSAQIGRPCLLGYIGKCSAPCVKRISEEEHRALAEDFCDFMAGQTARFARRLEAEMKQAAREEEFERAARLRDDLRGARARDREAGGGARRRHRLRRDRPGRRPARGGRPGVLRARRAGPRPARLGAGQGRGRDHRRPGRGFPRPGLRRHPGRCRGGQRRHTPRGSGARAAAGPGRDDAVADRTPRRPGRPAGTAARGQEGPDGDRGQERAASRWPCTRPAAPAT